MIRLLLLSATVLVAALLALPVLAASSAQTVRVSETSYRISLSAKPRSGMVKFIVKNASDDPHNFYVRGGGKTFKSRIIGLGRTTTLTANLRKGVRYTYWCSVGDHAEEGMRGTFVAR